MEEKNEKNNDITKTPNKKEIQKYNKKEDLCKRYFYINKNAQLKKLNSQNIYHLLNNQELSENFFQKINEIDSKSRKKRIELEKTKESCIQSLILNNKKIPEKWIIRHDYKSLLNKAMENDIVLNYAIENKELHERRAGYQGTDEERYENYIKEEKKKPPAKKFILYINPYNRYIPESLGKMKIRKDYCLSLDNGIDRSRRSKFLKKEKNKCLYNNLELSDIKKSKDISIENNENKLPNIFINKKVNTQGNNDNNENLSNSTNEFKDNFNITSLYYSGYDVNDENKDKKNIELPKIGA